MISAINVKDGHKTLYLVWSNGDQTSLSAKYLRANARDAASKRALYDGKANPVADDITITDIKVLGGASLNIHFSDGHERAIYPYSFLKELSELDDNKLTLTARD